MLVYEIFPRPVFCFLGTWGAGEAFVLVQVSVSILYECKNTYLGVLYDYVNEGRVVFRGCVCCVCRCGHASELRGALADMTRQQQKHEAEEEAEEAEAEEA